MLAECDALIRPEDDGINEMNKIWNEPVLKLVPAFEEIVVIVAQTISIGCIDRIYFRDTIRIIVTVVDPGTQSQKLKGIIDIVCHQPRKRGT